MSCNLLKKKELLILVALIFVLNVNLVFANLNYTTGSKVFGILADSGNTSVTGALNLTLQVRTCALANCSDGVWSANYTNATYTSLASLNNATFFQYLATFFTQDQNYTPYLFNVTLGYTYLDTTYPLISYGIGTAVDYANLSQSNIYVNVSWTEANLANITFSLYNNTAMVNSTAFNSSTYAINWTNLPVSNYTYWVNISDFAGNQNATLIRHIWIDTTLPNATLNTPANNSYLNYSTNINLTANLSDVGEGIKNATLNIYNSTNSLINQTSITGYAVGTLSSSAGIVVTLVDGVYTWFYSLFDWAGNQFTTQNNTLTADTTYPQINFTDPTPANNTGRSKNFTITALITEQNLANVTLYFNGTITNFDLTNNASYFSGTAPNYVFNFTQTGLVIGNSYIYNLSVADKANNRNYTETRTIKGAVAPSYISINQTPAITDYNNLDPLLNVTVTANLSDTDNNFDTAILQWKNSTAGVDWNNITMQNTTAKGIYTIVNATLPLPAYEGNITYRIWANDSVNEVSNSSSYIIQSFWDCTWTVSPSSLEEKIGFFEDKFIGNVTINNTGDSPYANNNCSIEFTFGWSGFSTDYAVMTLDPTNWLTSNTYFQFPFLNRKVTLNASSSQIFGVNASFPSTISVFTETPSITISSSINDSISKNKTASISSTLIVSPPNPLLYQSIETYPTTFVYLTPQNISLKAYTRNLGYDASNPTNTTAYNVNFNWTLSPDLASRVSDGNTTSSYDTLNTSSKQYSNLTIGLTEANLVSMPKGILNATIYSYGYKNSSGNLSLIANSGNQTLLNETVSIQFLCYPVSDGICVSSCGIGVDPDCVAVSAGTIGAGGGGGGGGVASGGQTSVSEATYELLRGQAQEFNLSIDNKYPGQLKNIKISVSGINANYISIEPNSIASIPGYSSQIIKIKITAPAYFTESKYTLVFDIVSTLESNVTEIAIDEKRTVTLLILETSRASADTLINETQNLIAEMNASGFYIKDMQKLLGQMNASYSTLDFSQVKSIYEQAKIIYDNALEAKSIIDELNKDIAESTKNGILIMETIKLLYIGEAAFERGDYALALARLQEARLTYALETKGEFNLAVEVKNNPLQSLGILIGLGLLGIGSTLFVRFQIYKKKLRALKEEEILLLELMKIIQKECFERNHMSMEEYEAAMSQYEARLSEIVARRIGTETKVANMLKFRGRRKALLEEKKRLIDNLKKTQDDYLNKGKIETRVYENMIRSYIKRLSEVDEEIATNEAEAAIKRGREIKRVFKVR